MVLALLGLGSSLFGQKPAVLPAQGAGPEFEAATVKPVKNPDPNRARDRIEGRRFVAYHQTLRDLMMMAYRVDAQQTVGGPGWLASDEYDVEAVAEDEKQMQADGQVMLQRLLAERFQLKFHREQRTLAVYALAVGKGGPKLKAAEGSGEGSASCEHFGRCSFRNEPMEHFVRWLGFAILDRPVNDETGLAGKYDFTLQWTPDETQFSNSGLRARAAGENATLPPLFDAIGEQLGLKLEPRKVPAEVLVIDRAERPTEN
ncbi:MAG: TIGR03435 family protein [Terracidiphilus sp.]|nr:TIGR03435 family protein [Terracidiphilus sp.]